MAVAATYCEEMAAAVCGRLAAGWSLTKVGRAAGMPSVSTLKRWMRWNADFSARVNAARGAPAKGGRPSLYSRAMAEAVCLGLMEGFGLHQVCARPGMPAASTVWNWRQAYPDFNEAFELARDIQGQFWEDQIGEIYRTVTPETTGVARVKLMAARSQAGRLAPKGRAAAREAEPNTWVHRHFDVAQELSDGSMVSVPQPGEPGRLAWEAVRKARSEAFHAAYAAECRALREEGLVREVCSLAVQRASRALELVWEHPLPQDERERMAALLDGAVAGRRASG